MTFFDIIITIIISYIVGSFPTAFIICYLTIKKDIRTLGSGNMGATNVLRSAGKLPAFLTLLIDIFKGYAVVIILISILNYSNYPWLKVIAGISVIIGHTLPVFLKFRGGKGVATACGVFLSLATNAFLIALVIFIITVSISKYISLGSIIAVIILPICIYFFDYHSSILIFSIIVSILIIYKHKANIKRLIKGNENKLSFNV